MSWTDFFARIEAAAKAVETVIDKASVFVKEAAPTAALVGTAIGNPEVVAAAQAATMIATATDKAIQTHQEQGGSTQSAIAGLVDIAKSVAESSVTSDATAAKINQIVGAVGG